MEIIMGSFNISCAVSNIDICCGDEVVAFLITPGKAIADSVIFQSNLYKMLTPFYLTGVYDDYGHFAPHKTDINEEVIKLWATLLNTNKEDLLNAVKRGLRDFNADNMSFSPVMWYVRKDVFDYCVARSSLDIEKFAGYANSIKEDLRTFIADNAKSMVPTELDFSYSTFRYNFLNLKTNTINKLQEKYEKIYDVPMTEMAILYIDHMGEGDGFNVKESVIRLLYNEATESMPIFTSLLFQTAEARALKRVMNALNIPIKPSMYAGQVPKFDVAASIYKKFAEIADEANKKELEKWNSWKYDSEEDDEMFGGIKEYGLTRE